MSSSCNLSLQFVGTMSTWMPFSSSIIKTSSVPWPVNISYNVYHPYAGQSDGSLSSSCFFVTYGRRILSMCAIIVVSFNQWLSLCVKCQSRGKLTAERHLYGFNPCRWAVHGGRMTPIRHAAKEQLCQLLSTPTIWTQSFPQLLPAYLIISILPIHTAQYFCPFQSYSLPTVSSQKSVLHTLCLYWTLLVLPLLCLVIITLCWSCKSFFHSNLVINRYIIMEQWPAKWWCHT